MASPYAQPEPLPPANGQQHHRGSYGPPANHPRPGPYGYGPGFPPPQPFARKKFPRWGWLLIVVAACFFVWLITDGLESRTAAARSAVRDGQFEFEVTNLEQGSTDVGGPGIFGDTAKGDFVVVHVHVSEFGDERSTFTADDQTLIDDGGRKYSGPGKVFGDKPDPGLPADEIVAFDVPPGTTPHKFGFHDSSLSGGVTVMVK